MDTLFGKIRIYGSGTVTITSPLGFSKTVTLTGTFTDVVLKGLEEYTISDGTNSQTVILNYGGFEQVTL